VATISADEDEVDRWVKEQNAKGRKCACGCGRTVAVLRRHYWMGLPKFHGECRHKAMHAKRASVTGGKYINGTELARKLGISRTTLKRWVEAGKLPKPKKSISGMLLFKRAAVC
jgi:predicted DNA-binding transcriptional regulator AlpA